MLQLALYLSSKFYVLRSMKMNAKQLRDLPETEAKSHLVSLKRRPVYFILENVYDTYNIGGLFRLADALNIERMYLCGDMETPPNHKIAKASIGTYKIVPWVYKSSAAEAIAELRSQYSAVSDQKLTTDSRPRITILAVEQSKDSVDYGEADYSLPVALILGNETSGVTEATLKLCDQIVEIPMWGINTSLNVIVSAAIVAYSFI